MPTDQKTAQRIEFLSKNRNKAQSKRQKTHIKQQLKARKQAEKFTEQKRNKGGINGTKAERAEQQSIYMKIFINIIHI